MSPAEPWHELELVGREPGMKGSRHSRASMAQRYRNEGKPFMAVTLCLKFDFFVTCSSFPLLNIYILKNPKYSLQTNQVLDKHHLAHNGSSVNIVEQLPWNTVSHMLASFCVALARKEQRR